MTAPNKIALITRGRYDEFAADADCYPGYLLMLNSDGGVQAHNVVGGSPGCIRVAQEDALSGGTITTKIPSGSVVPVREPAKGDLMLMILSGVQNVTKGAKLMSNGDGTLTQSLTSRLYGIAASSTRKDTFTTAAVFSNGTYTLPANSLQVGDVITIKAKLTCLQVTATPTFHLLVKIGATTLWDSGAISMIAADVAYVTVTLTMRTIGASGTFIASEAGYSSATATFTHLDGTTASTAIDTTATQAITALGQCSASSGSNGCELTEYTIDIARLGGGVPIAEAFEAINAAALTVTAASNASPIVITTSAAHGLYNGQLVTIASVGGNTNANVTNNAIQVLSSTTFAIVGINGNSAYTSGGTVTANFFIRVAIL